jgi:hypothetical protein
MCKEMPAIPVNRVVDKKRMIGLEGGEAQRVSDPQKIWGLFTSNKYMYPVWKVLATKKYMYTVKTLFNRIAMYLHLCM